MASHHRRKALQHLRITSGRTVLRELGGSCLSSGSWGQVGRSRRSRRRSSILRQWRINQWRGGFRSSRQLAGAAASGASAVSVGAAAGSASVKGGKPAVSSDVTAAVATAVSSAKLVKRQYTGSTAERQRERLARAGGSISSSWWRSFIRGTAAAAAGRAAQADLTAGSVAAGSSYSNGELLADHQRLHQLRQVPLVVLHLQLQQPLAGATASATAAATAAATAGATAR